MQMINQGCIKVPSDWRSTLVIILNAVGIETKDEDVWIENGKAINIIEDLDGNIEDQLIAIVNSFNVFDIPVDISIDYSGDYKGRYITRNGELVDLGEYEVAIMEAHDDDLIKELESRGYKVTKEN